MEADEFDKELEELLQICIGNNANYHVWWFYKSRPRNRYLDDFNSYVEFVRAGIHAHFAALVLGLSKLFDSGSEARSLFNLIAIGGRANFLDLQRLAAIREERREAATLWERVRPIRNEVVAHVQLRGDTYEVFRRAGLTYNDIRRLVDLGLSLTNSLLDMRRKGTWMPDDDPRRHAIKLFETLRQTRLKRERPDA